MQVGKAGGAMNNKEDPKQRFIVTREEIQNYGKQRERFRDATFGSPCQPLFEAEQAVFKRPVPEWPTDFVESVGFDSHEDCIGWAVKWGLDQALYSPSFSGADKKWRWNRRFRSDE